MSTTPFPWSVRSVLLVLVAVGLSVFAVPASVRAEGVDVWWPVEGAKVSGSQPFKGLVSGRDVNSYRMFWQVDAGTPVPMESNWEGYPHKEAVVDLSGWNWRGSGPYALRVSARDLNGNMIGERSVNIYLDAPSPPEPSTIDTNQSAGGTTPAPVEVVPPQVRAVAESTTSEPISATTPRLDIWWPAEGAAVSGVEPWKGLLVDKPLSEYELYWQVDGDRLNRLPDNWEGVPHKEDQIDLSGWNWKGRGPYRITFVAKNGAGGVLAEQSVNIYVANSGDAPAALTPASTGPLAGMKFYRDPDSSAKLQADAWRHSRPDDARQMDKIAAESRAVWIGGWNQNVARDVDSVMRAAAAQNSVPVFVVYNIPSRDCGGYSAGGGASADAYRLWVRDVARGLAGRSAVVVLEPDALAQMDCLNSENRSGRTAMLKDAVDVLKSQGAKVYLDAGHARWIEPAEMGRRLRDAGVGSADGFSLNVSNFLASAENVAYGEKVSAAADGKHFVVDSSRNGNGSNGEWCNPLGRALGARPAASTGHPLADAFLWLKVPGESDGWCNGGPAAGTWWSDYALDLARRAAY